MTVLYPDLQFAHLTRPVSVGWRLGLQLTSALSSFIFSFLIGFVLLVLFVLFFDLSMFLFGTGFRRDFSL
ncbi:uncharacterized protein ASCRUDRAFT_134325 [Ascoidea rubescens DSM 1968]|uniref:Uncharacterized protein n=1 Tax=Ascoidea rubescens DSM 1968 TaxID=1344418 RepID=A0A1D2VL78_9ASCO|nr:hypothetical protein ASCRUDRAFT_134325 [Ascoidea rubescens DSM 1968]ODV62345.1 hypothetical protein ASCRUDRAFT_134325 [Ascoidea rubescens DSM 1968]